MSYKLTILMPNGVFEANVLRIKKDRIDFPKCDVEGNVLNTPKKTKKVFDNSISDRQKFSYKLINGSPKAKLKRTKVIKNYKLVDPLEASGLIVEQYYLVDCLELQQHLQFEDKAMKTIYTNGNGFKAYESYILNYKDHLIMMIGYGHIDQQIEELSANRIPLHQRAKILDTEVERVDEAELFEAVEMTPSQVYQKEKDDHFEEVKAKHKIKEVVK